VSDSSDIFQFSAVRNGGRRPGAVRGATAASEGGENMAAGFFAEIG